MPRTRLRHLFLLLTANALGQTAPPSAPQQTPQTVAPTIQTRTNLVVEDIVVTDRAGNPVHGLTRADFTITEQGQPQQIRTFEEHVQPPPAAPPEPPLDLPPGTFTNYTRVPPSTALNVLLIDTLNTPLTDQAFVRQQLLKYIQAAPAGQRLAIFGLTSHLILLQGFTDDPDILRSVVDRKSMRSSVLLDNATVGGSPEPLSNMISNLGASSGAIAQAAANMQQFDADTAAFQLQVRSRYTLDAFASLARYLAAFPGRKNVLWFSGSFPINIFPDATLKDAFRATADLSSDLRDTAVILARAQVAVYPIDARGLFNDPTFDSSNNGQSLFQPGGSMAANQRFMQQTAAEHATMLDMALQTGGRAIINNNGLAQAVDHILHDGSNFYTFTYSPTDTRLDNTYRAINLKLQGQRAAQGLSLAFRHGYFAVDPRAPASSATAVPNPDPHAVHPQPGSAAPSPAALTPPTSPQTSPAVYAALLRGAPPSASLIFKASIHPTAPPSANSEPTLAPHNQPNPRLAHPPFRNYAVDFAVFPSQMLSRDSTGNYVGSIRFVTIAYNIEGESVTLVDETTGINVAPERYNSMLHGGLRFEQVISVPQKGDIFLRLGVVNLLNGHVGSLEAPLAAIKNLPPQPSSAPPPSAVPAPAQP